MPELTSFNWLMICIAISATTGLSGFFLKDVFKKNEKQSDEINEIQKDYPSRSELNGAISSLRGENRGIVDKLDRHEQEIQTIKQAYATKDDLKDMRLELRSETKALADDVTEIKSNYLTKDEYLRRQVETDRKLDRIFDFLLKGGSGHG